EPRRDQARGASEASSPERGFGGLPQTLISGPGGGRALVGVRWDRGGGPGDLFSIHRGHGASAPRGARFVGRRDAGPRVGAGAPRTSFVLVLDVHLGRDDDGA